LSLLNIRLLLNRTGTRYIHALKVGSLDDRARLLVS
jgi:hypothetical protein